MIQYLFQLCCKYCYNDLVVVQAIQKHQGIHIDTLLQKDASDVFMLKVVQDVYKKHNILPNLNNVAQNGYLNILQWFVSLDLENQFCCDEDGDVHDAIYRGPNYFEWIADAEYPSRWDNFTGVDGGTTSERVNENT